MPETVTSTGRFQGSGAAPVHLVSLTGGTTGSDAQVDTAGTGAVRGGTFYAVNYDFVLNIAVRQLQTTQESPIAQKFRQLADQWRKETGHFSSVTKKVMHPAYQQIIGMGREALPLILRELKRTPGHWLWALFSITGEDPAPEGSTFAEAVDAWLSWGIRHGYATPD